MKRPEHSPEWRNERPYIVPAPKLGSHRGLNEQKARELEQRERLRRVPVLMKYKHPTWNGNGVGEAEVVYGEQLSNILKRWIVAYLAEKQLDTGSDIANLGIMGPINWLNEHTKTIENPTGMNLRRIQGFVNGEYTWVGLSLADRLMKAIGFSHVFRNGELQVIPNPNWSMEKWVAYQQARRGCD